ncbi:mechanosensitive ion channel family protein [Paenibacillus senegalensis]|uniref:mechanosensitive ion channel family protein n=1 Tax=Paenibacillus senegalensis TaxID=1465766 RepID=UPI001F260CB1|nr:mechanosensitive ion channel family protein [Paenibacillus senegalensis]
MGRLIGNSLTYSINFILIMMILNQLGINLLPLLAGAGVVGLAIGFGAQSLVKDVITGFFIIFEDQFAVGDTVQIGAHKGTVEEIGLRVTRIVSWTGEVHIIPNGLIAQVTNYSINNTIATVDINLPYQSNVDRAMAILDQALSHFKERTANVMGRPQILGMQSMSQSEVSLRIAVECRPDTHIEVQRLLLAEVKKILDDHRLEIEA